MKVLLCTLLTLSSFAAFAESESNESSLQFAHKTFSTSKSDCFTIQKSDQKYAIITLSEDERLDMLVNNISVQDLDEELEKLREDGVCK